MFWQSIHAGANRAGKELGVEVIWRGPLREDDRDSQVSEVEGVRQPRRLRHRARAARRSGARRSRSPTRPATKIPVVIFDSGLKGDDYVSFVATDNLKGGRIGGERLAEAIEGQGQGHAAALRRRARQHRQARGGLPRRDEGASRHRGRQLQPVRRRRRRRRLQEERSRCSAATRSRTAASASTASSTPNESTTFAMLRVLQDNGWAGKVKFVGFDASRQSRQRACATAHIDGLVAAGSGQHGLSRGQDDGGAPEGAAGREAHRHGVHVATHDNMEAGDGSWCIRICRNGEARGAAPPRFEMRGVRKAFGATAAFRPDCSLLENHDRKVCEANFGTRRCCDIPAAHLARLRNPGSCIPKFTSHGAALASRAQRSIWANA